MLGLSPNMFDRREIPDASKGVECTFEPFDCILTVATYADAVFDRKQLIEWVKCSAKSSWRARIAGADTFTRILKKTA